MKKILTIFIILNLNYIEADERSDTREIIEKPFVNSLTQEANIFNLNLTPESIVLKSTYTSRPSSKTLLKLTLPKKSDEYFLRFLDKDKKENIILGLGNPFYANFQHIGYEDSKVHGGLVSSANIEVAIPMNIKAQYIVISRKNSLGVIKDIQEIKIPKS
tara:strand:+ start:512 stop:991 length:480 start_codon:yes stop_codon:yes gene_type:complete